MLQHELVTQIADARPKILVVGDIMLDHYRIADATRISPEAPVPVLLNPRDEFRLGGAAAVAVMCAALGAEVVVMGLLGQDSGGDRILKLLNDAGVTFAGKIGLARPTTVKERICGVASGRHRQQLARVDIEDSTPLPRLMAAEFALMIQDLKGDPPDAVIISDYAKGLCVDSIIQACRDLAVPVFVDPPKDCDWPRYHGVECVVPNREESTGKIARDLCRQLQSRAIVVKLDQDGCDLFLRGSVWQDGHIPARARFVHDVTGAGDQFIAVLACARAAGLDWRDSAILANSAAGLQVERHGCVPVTIEDLKQEFARETPHSQLEQPGRPMGEALEAAAS